MLFAISAPERDDLLRLVAEMREAKGHVLEQDLDWPRQQGYSWILAGRLNINETLSLALHFEAI